MATVGLVARIPAARNGAVAVTPASRTPEVPTAAVDLHEDGRRAFQFAGSDMPLPNLATEAEATEALGT